MASNTDSESAKHGEEPMTWTDERIELLRRLWADGLSASQIAAQLGGGVTRNAVIGKVHRLGLSGRAKPASTTARPRRPRPATPPRAPRPMVIGNTALKLDYQPEPRRMPMQEEEVLLAPESRRITILQLTDQTCKWPIGDPSGSDFHFCGHQPRTGAPYCVFHARMAYQPVNDRRRERRLEPV